MMMKRVVFLTVCLSSLCIATARAEVELSVAPTSRIGFGDTRFELLVFGYNTDSVLVRGGSELVFPLDFVQTGIQLGMSVTREGHREWTADLSLNLVVSDPGDRMIDDDWYNVGEVELLWSHTLSEVDGSGWEVSLEGTRLLTAGQSGELSLLAGVTLQKFKQKMVDLTGWQYHDYDRDGQPEAYLMDDDQLGLTYEVRYVRPRIGLASRWQVGRFRTELQATLSPLLYVKDIDDHVRRGFQIRTDGKGVGAGSRLSLRYEQPSQLNVRPFVALSGDYFHAKIDTDGTRNYYVHDDLNGIERGDRVAESHDVSTTQYGLQLTAGVVF